jgi:hypothetical protein
MNRQVSPTILIFILLLFFMAVVYYVGTTSVGLALAKAGQQFVYAISGRKSSGDVAGYPNIPSNQQPTPITVGF